MRKVEHEVEGKKYLVSLPEGADNVDLGIELGPPNFTDSLELPEPFATKLHNQMFDRGLFTLDDLRRRSREVQAALQSALRLDAATIINAYAEAEKENLPFD
jgi:hypothetical protein